LGSDILLQIILKNKISFFPALTRVKRKIKIIGLNLKDLKKIKLYKIQNIYLKDIYKWINNLEKIIFWLSVEKDQDIRYDDDNR